MIEERRLAIKMLPAHFDPSGQEIGELHSLSACGQGALRGAPKLPEDLSPSW
jgi:hypothetical protein